MAKFGDDRRSRMVVSGVKRGRKERDGTAAPLPYLSDENMLVIDINQSRWNACRSKCSMMKMWSDTSTKRLINDLTLVGANTYHHIYASSKTHKSTTTLITSNLLFMDMDRHMTEEVSKCNYLSLLSIDIDTNDEVQITWMLRANIVYTFLCR